MCADDHTETIFSELVLECGRSLLLIIYAANKLRAGNPSVSAWWSEKVMGSFFDLEWVESISRSQLSSSYTLTQPHTQLIPLANTARHFWLCAKLFGGLRLVFAVGSVQARILSDLNDFQCF